MKIKHSIVPKREVKYCLEDFNLKQALDLLWKSGYRCIPVLSKDEKKFLGNIYKVHILEYTYEDKELLDENIMTLVKDSDACVDSNQLLQYGLTEVFLYPYLVALDRDGDFEGILTHKNVINLLNDATGMRSKGISFGISSSEMKGTVGTLGNLVKKHANINSIIAYDDGDKLVRRMNFTIPNDTPEKVIHALTKDLESNGFRVLEIENLKLRKKHN